MATSDQHGACVSVTGHFSYAAGTDLVGLTLRVGWEGAVGGVGGGAGVTGVLGDQVNAETAGEAWSNGTKRHSATRPDSMAQ